MYFLVMYGLYMAVYSTVQRESAQKHIGRSGRLLNIWDHWYVLVQVFHVCCGGRVDGLTKFANCVLRNLNVELPFGDDEMR